MPVGEGDRVRLPTRSMSLEKAVASSVAGCRESSVVNRVTEVSVVFNQGWLLATVAVVGVVPATSIFWNHSCSSGSALVVPGTEASV